jgi:hypothetical protein
MSGDEAKKDLAPRLDDRATSVPDARPKPPMHPPDPRRDDGPEAER